MAAGDLSEQRQHGIEKNACTARGRHMHCADPHAPARESVRPAARLSGCTVGRRAAVSNRLRGRCVGGGAGRYG